MNFMNILAAAQETAAEGGAQIVFEPSNFVTSLQYMGIGMLVIFAIIGIIALTTMLLNKIFSE